MLAKQINPSLMYSKYRVVAIDNNDTAYFVEYVRDTATRKLEYCWCRANQTLSLRSQVDGYLCPTEQNDRLPTLIVGECNSIVPTVSRRIALVGR